MATKNDIITLPNSELRKKSLRVGIITEQVKAIIKNMKEATIDWEANREHEVGVALAAVQINQHYKIVIKDYEGCLSVKDIYGLVPRYKKVKVKALDINGKPFRITAEGFLARVLQHEIDHNNGKLFIDIIKDNPDAFFKLQPDGKLQQLDYENEIKNNKDLWQ